jgi:hypothetical protein
MDGSGRGLPPNPVPGQGANTRRTLWAPSGPKRSRNTAGFSLLRSSARPCADFWTRLPLFRMRNHTQLRAELGERVTGWVSNRSDRVVVWYAPPSLRSQSVGLLELGCATRRARFYDFNPALRGVKNAYVLMPCFFPRTSFPTRSARLSARPADSGTEQPNQKDNERNGNAPNGIARRQKV